MQNITQETPEGIMNSLYTISLDGKPFHPKFLWEEEKTILEMDKDFGTTRRMYRPVEDPELHKDKHVYKHKTLDGK